MRASDGTEYDLSRTFFTEINVIGTDGFKTRCIIGRDTKQCLEFWDERYLYKLPLDYYILEGCRFKKKIAEIGESIIDRFNRKRLIKIIGTSTIPFGVPDRDGWIEGNLIVCKQ